MATETKTLTQADIDNYPGGDTLYHHGLFKSFNYTEGIREMAIKGGAYWLIDMIAGAQFSETIRGNRRLLEFQVWELVLSRLDRGALLECREDTGCDPAISKHISHTDFPLPSIKLFYSNDVLYLPCEH